MLTEQYLKLINMNGTDKRDMKYRYYHKSLQNVYVCHIELRVLIYNKNSII